MRNRNKISIEGMDKRKGMRGGGEKEREVGQEMEKPMAPIPVSERSVV